MKPKHIHYAHCGKACAKQIGPLRHASTYQQSTIATTLNRQLRALGVFFINEPLRPSNKIIKDILFKKLGARFMPSIAILTTTSQVCNCEYPTHFQPSYPADRKRRRKRNIKTAIPIQQHRVVAIFLQPLAISDKHRHLSAIFAWIKDLLDLIIIGVELNLCGAINFAGAFFQIITINGRWRCEAGKRVKGFAGILPATKTTCSSNPRQRKFRRRFPID